MLDFFGSNSSQTWEKSTSASFCNFSGNLIDGVTVRAISHQPIMGDVMPEIENLENLIEKSDDSWILGKSAIAPQSREDLRLENYNSASSIDGLTGETLSISNDGNLPISPIVEQAVRSAQFYLSGLATDTDFAGKMNLAFGNSWNADVANNLVKAFAQGDFSKVPAIEILPSAAINGANGAFASVTNTIYLAKEFVEQNAGNPGAITSVLLEEIGHYIDSKINVFDAAGDEGDIFARVVQGKAISGSELLELKAEDDTAVLSLNGQVFWIEQSTVISQVNFRTFEKGKYVVAEGGGGSTVNANRDIAGSWETFSLIDLNDGSLNSGDFVNIVTQNGRYMVAEGGGGGVVNANRTAAGPWEKFRVIKVNGSGKIGSGDTIALSASNGQYLVAEGGGGTNVNANRNAIGSWEKFIINFGVETSGFPIQGSIGSFYNSNPNIAQDLGKPTGNEFQFVSGKWRQNFQGGAIFHSSNGTYSVRGSLGNYYLNIGGQNSQVGLPTGELVHNGNGNWQQNFEKGFIEWLNNGTGRVISTEKVGNPDIDIKLYYPNGGFTNTQKAIFEQAATNWESIITRDKVSTGILKIAITQGSKGISGTNWGSGIGAESSWDKDPNYRNGDGKTHFNSAFINGFPRNNLLRLTMHELGHTLGLDDAQHDSSLYDTAGDSLMDFRTPAKGGQDMKITEGMYKKMEWLGYGVNRNPYINWS